VSDEIKKRDEAIKVLMEALEDIVPSDECGCRYSSQIGGGRIYQCGECQQNDMVFNSLKKAKEILK